MPIGRHNFVPSHYLVLRVRIVVARTALVNSGPKTEASDVFSPPSFVRESRTMFERYTERARRVIFFGRYEASQFGSTSIEVDHLLLGMLREDHSLFARFLRGASLDSIRKEVTDGLEVREKVPTSIDLPLTEEGKLVFKYASEEAERLKHNHI